MIAKCVVVVVLSLFASSVRSSSHEHEFDHFRQRGEQRKRSDDTHPEVHTGYRQYHHSRNDDIDQEQGTSHYYEVRKHPDHKFEYHIGHKRPEKHRETQNQYKPKKSSYQHHNYEYSTTQLPQRQEDTYSQFHEHQKINEEIYKFKQLKVLNDEKPKNINYRFNSDRGNAPREQQKNKFHYEKEKEQKFQFRPEKPSPFKLPKQYEREENVEPSHKHEVRQGSKTQYAEYSEKPKYKTVKELNQRYKNHNYDKEDSRGQNIGHEEEYKYNQYVQQEAPRVQQQEPSTPNYPNPNEYRNEEEERKKEPFRPSQESNPKEDEEEYVPYVRPYPAYLPEPYVRYPEPEESRFRRPSDDLQLGNEQFRNNFDAEVQNSRPIPDRRLPYILDKPASHRNLKDRRPSTDVGYLGRQENQAPLNTVRTLSYEPKREVQDTPYKFEKPVPQKYFQENPVGPNVPFKSEVKLPQKKLLAKPGGGPQGSDDLRFSKAFSDMFGSPPTKLPAGKKSIYFDGISDPETRGREVTVPRYQRYASRRRSLNNKNLDVTKDIDISDFFKTLYNH